MTREVTLLLTDLRKLWSDSKESPTMRFCFLELRVMWSLGSLRSVLWLNKLVLFLRFSK